jgi:hypothetical protein
VGKGDFEKEETMIKKRVLIACEFSGRVREAFRKKGHDAWSCDLIASEIPGAHIQTDVRMILRNGWDLMIAHPPCVDLAVSGARYFKDKKEKQKEAIQFVLDLMDAPIPQICIENPVSVISSKVGNPAQVIHPWQFGETEEKTTCLWLKGLPRLEPTKIIPPVKHKLVKFAADLPLCPDCNEEAYCDDCKTHFSECDCYEPTQDGVFYHLVDGILFGTEVKNLRPRWTNQTISGQNKLGPSPDRSKIRARTYPGIAEAMAEQWGKALRKAWYAK